MSSAPVAVFSSQGIHSRASNAPHLPANSRSNYTGRFGTNLAAIPEESNYSYANYHPPKKIAAQANRVQFPQANNFQQQPPDVDMGESDDVYGAAGLMAGG